MKFPGVHLRMGASLSTSASSLCLQLCPKTQQWIAALAFTSFASLWFIAADRLAP